MNLFLALLLISVISIPVVLGVIAHLKIPADGTIIPVGVESDTSEIHWGELKVGASKTYDIRVRPVADFPLVLNYEVSNWNPANATNFLVLSWNYTENPVIQPNVWTGLTFILTVNPDTTGITNFSFDILLAGTSQ